MDVFRIVRGIAIQEKQMMANHKQVQRTEERTKELNFLEGKRRTLRGAVWKIRIFTAFHCLNAAVSHWLGCNPEPNPEGNQLKRFW